MFALVDCNNFYAPCERVFNPKLANRPVILLSKNDGCAVARSEEAKAIGIQMGAPAFKIRHLINAHQVAVISSNYALYGDMSRRVMQTLSRFTDLKAAIINYTSRGAEKLRAQESAANMMLVFAATKRFKSHYDFHTATAQLPVPTNDTPELIHYADQCLRQFYKPGTRFKKAGVIFKDLVCSSPLQTGLFDKRNRKRSQILMRSIDTINAEMGDLDLVKFSKNLHEESTKLHRNYKFSDIDFTNKTLKQYVEEMYQENDK